MSSGSWILDILDPETQSGWKVDGLCSLSFGGFPHSIESVWWLRQRTVTDSCIGEMRSEKKLSSWCWSSVCDICVSQIWSNQLPTTEISLVTLAAIPLSEAISSPGKLFLFVLGLDGGRRGRISFAGRMWVCWRAFAQRKCPTLSPGRRRLPDGVFFTLSLVPKWQLSSVSKFWTWIDS